MKDNKSWRWSYLENPNYLVRQAVAAFLLQKCDHVIEIGPGKAPISLYYHGSYSSYDVITNNPIEGITLEDIPCEGILGVCIIGLDSCYENLSFLLSFADVIVVEAATNWVIRGGAKVLLEGLGINNKYATFEIDQTQFGSRTMWYLDRTTDEARI